MGLVVAAGRESFAAIQKNVEKGLRRAGCRRLSTADDRRVWDVLISVAYCFL